VEDWEEDPADSSTEGRSGIEGECKGRSYEHGLIQLKKGHIYMHRKSQGSRLVQNNLEQSYAYNVLRSKVPVQCTKSHVLDKWLHGTLFCVCSAEQIP
jgi:hypothetical protein